MSDSALEHHEPEWEVSPWPLIISVGIVFLLPFAFALYFVYDQPMLSVVSLGIGTPLIVISLIGWVKGSYADIAHHGKEPGYGLGAMPFFIIAEAFIFIAFFGAYWVLRLSAPEWPPPGTPHMTATTPIIMTVVLVASSFTIHFGEMALAKDDKKGLLFWLIITIVLGTIFFGLSAVEWKHLMHGGFSFDTNLFSTFFFSITGFHGSHVLVGLSAFLCVLFPLLAGRVSHTFVKAVSVYWHFVDIIWFFVVSQIYFW